jgi:hypothetical protein
MKTKATSDFRVTLERNHTMKLQLFRSALLLVLVGIPALASAEETIPQDGLWAKVGLGASSTNYSYDGGGYNGGAQELRAAVGTVISPRNVLHASLGINRLAEPESTEQDDTGGGEITGTSGSTFSLVSACAGFTRYFGAASVTARAGYAMESVDEGADESMTSWIAGASLDYDFSASESSRFGVGLNMDYAPLDSGSLAYTSIGLFLNGTFY